MNKYEKKVTIIVPVYNGEKYLAKCLESITTQNYMNLEIIIVNDGSSDSSLEIIKRFQMKDDRIRLISKKNEGVSAARNDALNISTGDYIALIDQDDCVAVDYVSYMMKLIDYNEADIAIVPKAQRFIGREPIMKDNNNDYVTRWSGEEAAKQMLYYNIIIGPWNKLISRKIIIQNHIKFNSDLFGGEGFLFSIECFLAARSVAVGHKRVYYYRCDNSNSGMTKFRIKLVDSSIKAQKMIRKLFDEPSTDILNALDYANWHTHCDMFSYMRGGNAYKEYRELYQSIKKVCKDNAKCAFAAQIPQKEKCKAFFYMISPELAVHMVNAMRLRKYTKN